MKTNYDLAPLRRAAAVKGLDVYNLWKAMLAALGEEATPDASTIRNLFL